MIWTFLNLGKIGNLTIPPSDLIGKNLRLGTFGILGTPLGKNISLKHLKLPENHLKTNLYFVQLKHLQSIFKFGENLKSPNFQGFPKCKCRL